MLLCFSHCKREKSLKKVVTIISLNNSMYIFVAVCIPLVFLPRYTLNASQSSQDKTVCQSVYLSVCLSNACIVTKRKKDLSRFLSHTKDHLASFSKKNGWWGRPSTWNFGLTGPHWSEIADFEPIFARSASAVTASKKAKIGSPLRAKSPRWL